MTCLYSRRVIKYFAAILMSTHAVIDSVIADSNAGETQTFPLYVMTPPSRCVAVKKLYFQYRKKLNSQTFANITEKQLQVNDGWLSIFLVGSQ